MNTKITLGALLILWSSIAFASPLVQQWRGSGADADKLFCKYGNGQISVVSGNQNCPLSN